MKRSLSVTIVLFVSTAAYAACSGSSPAWTAASTSATDVQACLNESLACGDTVIVPAGTSTWTTKVTVTPPTGCAVNQGITLQGATTCTGSSGGSDLSCIDNTNITLSDTTATTLVVGPCSNTSFCSIAGFTFIVGVNYSNGNIDIQGTHGQVSWRFHHNHVTNAVSSAIPLLEYNGYGLNDHYLFTDTATTAAAALVPDGDFPTAGEANWNDTTNFGTNQAIYVEDSQFNYSHIYSEGVFDGHYGAKIVFRYNTVNGNELGGGHGTDSGQQRSVVLYEIYNNTIACPGGEGLMNTRGGTLLFFNNVVTGSCTGIDLQYYRYIGQVNSSSWGTARAGLNWTPVSAIPTNANSDLVTLNTTAWQVNHSYASAAAIGPTSGNAGAFNYQNTGSCTSGSTQPGSWNQTFGCAPGSLSSCQTGSDGTCTWTNVGGSTLAGPGGHGFCAANLDTPCSSDATCNALSGGDTCSAYMDATGGVYPYRDQPGRVHNQVLAPNYAWNNSGAGLPSPVLGTDTGSAGIIQSGVDYYNTTAMPGYAPYQYPDPLQGSFGCQMQGFSATGVTLQ